MSEPKMIADPIPDGSITEHTLSDDPAERFARLFRQRSDGDPLITDELLSEAFRQTVPGLPEGAVKITVSDPVKPSYSVANPSPEFLRFRSDDTGLERFHNEPGLVIVRDDDPSSNEPTYFAVGPAFTDLQSSDDYAFGSTGSEAFGNYLEGLKARVKQEAIDHFIQADKSLETAKKLYQHYDDAVANLSRIMAIGDHFQDKDGTVYQLAPQEWIKVKVKPVTVNRTRREGERNGDLSMTAARELGYIVEGEGKKEPKVPKEPKPDPADFKGRGVMQDYKK